MNRNDCKGKSNTRGKRRGKREKEVEVNIDDSRINRADLKPSDNDYTWYTRYKALFSNVTGVNFGNQVGSQIRWNPASVGPDTSFYNSTAAGICAVHYIPTLGGAGYTLNNPVSKVATQMYAAMRMELGSTSSYDPTDIMLYMGGMDSAYMLYALGAKIYGMLRMASPFNNYFLQNVCAANNVDYSSFSLNLSNFRSKLNQYAIFLTSRLVPGSFDIFRRHVWILQNMFTDSDTAKAQIYTFVPDGYYIYTEATEGPAYLKFMPFAHAVEETAKLTFQQWTTAINNVYESLMGSSDIDQMSADIYKAFKGDTFVLSTIPEDYITPIGYSKEVLSQIENTILCGIYRQGAVGNTGYNSFDIYQVVELPKAPRLAQAAYTRYQTKTATWNADAVNVAQKAAVGRKLLNFHWSDPSKEDVIVATRGIPGYISTSFVSNQAHNIIQQYGTEVFTYAVMYDIKSDETLRSHKYAYVNADTGDECAQFASIWNQFDWAPACFRMTVSGLQLYRMQDIDMYGLVDDLQLADINVTAVLSEFYSDKFPNVD